MESCSTVVRIKLSPKMKRRNPRLSGLLLLCLTMTSGLRAQERRIGGQIDYNTEFQYDFGDRANWLNLLFLEADFPVSMNGTFGLQTLSFYKAAPRRIADDLQVFSNIEADNTAVNIYFLGYSHSFKKITLFGGMRSVNHDYFQNPYTCLFINSSPGVYPTLADNFRLANYPASGVCLHVEYRISKRFTLRNSLYNGIARELLDSRWGAFSFSPGRDGLINITTIDYANVATRQGRYGLGFLVHTKFRGGADGATAVEPRRRGNFVVWGNAEQVLFRFSRREVGLLLQASFAPKAWNDCSSYFGVGVVCKGLFMPDKKDTFGVLINRAGYAHVVEHVVEATWQYALSKQIALQPSFQYILTGNQTYFVGLVRAIYTLCY